jgi:hypothetical protein
MMKPPSWTAAIRGWTDIVSFKPALDVVRLVEAERLLGGPLHADLRTLLLESNGVAGEYDLGLIWPIYRILEDNIAFRTDPVTNQGASGLLFFADAGNGDQFAYVVSAQSPPEIHVWDHADGTHRWVAASLAGYLEGWLSGRLKV